MERADGSRVDTIIVGGGIAGLAAAWHLHSRTPRRTVVLLEEGCRVGGKLLTDEIDGFVLEAGPDSFLAAKEQAAALIGELGIEAQIVPTRGDTRGSYVLWNGYLHPIPEGLSGLVPARLGPVFRSRLLSARGKARLALDYVLPPGKGCNDESLASFISRRLGVEAYERLVEPLMAGIYAGDGQQLSLNATFPQLRALET